ncbi:MAG: iron complex outermembrane receptor protein [Polaribacter sp.]
MSFRQFYKIICACLVLCSLPLWATENSAETELDFFGHMPMVLTASRMSKPILETPATVSIIDRKTIQSSGVREVAELFRLVPGFIVGFYNGNTPVVSYHGLGGKYTRQIQVLVDGRSVLIPSIGGVSWPDLPLLIEDIERIEVIRGPNAVTYGTSAFLATINIITRHAVEDYGTQYSVTTSDNANPNIKHGYVRHGYHHDDLDWRLSVGTSNDDGFRDVHDSKQINKINFRLDQASRDNQFWTVQFGTSNNTSDIGDLNNHIFDIGREFKATHSYFNLRWEKVGDTSSTIVKLSHTQQNVTDIYDAGPLTLFGIPNITLILDQSRYSERSNIEITHTKELDANLRFVYGASLRHDRVNAKLLTKDNRTHEVDTRRLFAGIEWRLNSDWLLDVGTSLENSSLSDNESSPRLSIIRKFSNSHALRFVASRAKRNPILYEHSALSELTPIFPNVGPVDITQLEGNPNLKPESIDSHEIGLRSQLIAPGISSDIKLFTYKITDQIIEAVFEEIHPLLGPRDVNTYNNQGETSVQGIELSFDFTTDTSLEFKSGLSVIDVESNDPSILRSFAERTGFIHAIYHWNDRHNLSASFYYLDDIRWFGGGSARPSFEKLDLRYACLISSANDTRVELIGQNLLEEYTDYSSDNIAEKTFLLRFSSGF